MVTISPLTASMTNHLFKIDVPEGIQPKSVILRLYGETGCFFERSIDIENYERVNLVGMAPKRLGNVEGGRIEEFLEGFCPLTSKEMKNTYISQRIAEKFAEFHIKTTSVQSLDSNPSSTKSLTVWERLWDWYHKAIEVQSDFKSYSFFPTKRQVDNRFITASKCRCSDATRRAFFKTLFRAFIFLSFRFAAWKHHESTTKRFHLFYRLRIWMLGSFRIRHCKPLVRMVCRLQQ